jgi:hypothetical protein
MDNPEKLATLSPPMTIQITSNKKICEIYFFLSNRRQFKKDKKVRNVVPYFHVRYDFWIKTMFVLYLSPVEVNEGRKPYDAIRFLVILQKSVFLLLSNG